MIYEGTCCMTIIVAGNDLATLVQILDKAVYVSLYTNVLWKSTNPSLLPQAMSK